MSESVHAMIVYGIRIKKSEVSISDNNPYLNSISSGNHVEDKTFCSFLYIESSCQEETTYDDNTLFNVDKMKKEPWWDDYFRNFCKESGIVFESPQWHIVVWYG